MNITRKLCIAGAGLSALGASAFGLVAVAGPASADTNNWTIAYHSNDGPVANGTATVMRTGDTVVVKITLDSQSTFNGEVSPNLQICASTTAFTSKVAGKDGCTSTTNGEWFSYTESGSSADVKFSLDSAYNNETGYLQIHLNTLDNGVANTSMVNPTDDSTPIYGNVKTTPLPVTAVGALGIAAGVGGVFVAMQRRRRRHGAGAASA